MSPLPAFRLRHARLYTLALMLLFGSSLAAPVKIAGSPMVPAVETRRDLDADSSSPSFTMLDERISLVAFPRFGVTVTDTSKGFTLTRGTFTLEYALPGGWVLSGLPLPNLRDPVAAEGQVWVPVKILGWLGFKISSATGGISVDALPNTPGIPTSAFVTAPVKPPVTPSSTPTATPAPSSSPTVATAPAASSTPATTPTAPSPTTATPPAPSSTPAPSTPAAATPTPPAPSTPTPTVSTPSSTPATTATTPSTPAVVTPTVTAVPPASPTGKPNLNKVLEARSSKGRTSRLVLDLAKAVEFRFDQVGARVRVMLKDTTVTPRLIPVGAESIGRARLLQEGSDAVLDVEVAARAQVKVSTLTAPDRLLVDAEIPDEKAPSPGATPVGVSLQAIPAEQLGLGSTATSAPTPTTSSTTATSGNGSSPNKLTLVTLDPTKYAPKLVTAPWGSARTVFEHAQASNAPIAVNGGYFDPGSNLPVDLIVTNGSVLAYSRGNRATVGFLGSNLQFGIPKVRLTIQPDGADAAPVNISTIRPNPHPQWVTAFVGDGFVPVGGTGFTTLVIGPPGTNGSSAILEKRSAAFVPAPGQFTVTFNPTNWPALEAQSGNIKLGMAWTDPSWNDIKEALAVGPKLITAGAIILNGTLEGFDTKGEIWRPTRQAALGLDAQNQYVIAVLENGSPEDLAQVLLKAGLREAVRLDSGTSAAVYVMGGMVGNKWGRTVPNAIVFMPRL